MYQLFRLGAQVREQDTREAVRDDNWTRWEVTVDVVKESRGLRDATTRAKEKRVATITQSQGRERSGSDLLCSSTKTQTNQAAKKSSSREEKPKAQMVLLHLNMTTITIICVQLFKHSFWG